MLPASTTLFGGIFLGIVDATCVVFCSASATTCWLCYFLYGTLNCLCSTFSCLCSTLYCFGSSFNSFFHIFFDANCVIFGSASATASGRCIGANCTGFVSTSTAGPGTTWNGYTATSQKADDTDSSKDLFQFLRVHGLFSRIRYALFPMKMAR